MEKQEIMKIMKAMLAEIKADNKTVVANSQEHLLATINANQAKADADRKADKEEMLSEIKANQETTVRMDAKIGSMQVELISTIKNFKFNGKETAACQETTEAHLEGKEEPASVDMTPEVADEEVPLEGAEVMAVGGPKKRRRDRRHLAAGRRQKEQQDLVAARRAEVAWRRITFFRKILTHEFCGLRKEVTAAGMKITRCAGHGHKKQNKDNVEQGTRKGRTENRRQKGPMCNTGIKNPTVNNIEQRNPRQRAPLGSGGSRKKNICDISRGKIMVTTRIGKVFERTKRLGIVKRSAGSHVALRMIKKWTQWRGRSPPKRKKEQEAEEEPVMWRHRTPHGMSE
jgi:hypothetical protein